MHFVASTRLTNRAFNKQQKLNTDSNGGRTQSPARRCRASHRCQNPDLLVALPQLHFQLLHASGQVRGVRPRLHRIIVLSTLTDRARSVPAL